MQSIPVLQNSHTQVGATTDVVAARTGRSSALDILTRLDRDWTRVMDQAGTLIDWRNPAKFYRDQAEV